MQAVVASAAAEGLAFVGDDKLKNKGKLKKRRIVSKKRSNKNFLQSKKQQNNSEFNKNKKLRRRDLIR